MLAKLQNNFLEKAALKHKIFAAIQFPTLIPSALRQTSRGRSPLSVSDRLVFIQHILIVLNAHIVVGDDQLQTFATHAADGQHTIVVEQTDNESITCPQ